MASNSLPVEVARLRRELAQVKKGQRLSHGASIENSAVVVRDESGSLRTILGVQGDGTVGVQAVNGPPPPAPSPPIVASVIGGVTASWDGGFAGGAIIPMDWNRVEVHASTSADFTPDPVTLQSTIETAQGGTVVVPCQNPVYVCLLARNTSGTGSIPSAMVGPFGPTPVVATEILDGIVTTAKLADDAVTAAKVAAAAIDSRAIADAAVNAQKIGEAAVIAGKLASEAVTSGAIAPSAVTTAKLDAGAVTTGKLAAGAVTANEIAANAIVSGKIAAGQILATHLTANSVQTAALAADSVAAGKIAASAVTAREIAALAVTADKIDANAITAGKIKAGAVDATALAADAITGKVITGGSINGTTITGGTMRTANSGQRVVIAPTGAVGTNSVEFFSGAANEAKPGAIYAWVDTDSTPPRPILMLVSPALNTGRGARLELVGGGGAANDQGSFVLTTGKGTDYENTIVSYSRNATTRASTTISVAEPTISPVGVATLTLYGGRLEWRDARGNVLSYDSSSGTPILNVPGMLTASNMAYGRVTITPSAVNTPTSATVTYARLPGTNFEGYACPSTAVPGTTVTGVSMSGVGATSALVWCTRANMTDTGVSWQTIGRNA